MNLHHSVVSRSLRPFATRGECTRQVVPSLGSICAISSCVDTWTAIQRSCNLSSRCARHGIHNQSEADAENGLKDCRRCRICHARARARDRAQAQAFAPFLSSPNSSKLSYCLFSCQSLRLFSKHSSSTFLIVSTMPRLPFRSPSTYLRLSVSVIARERENG